MSTAPAAAPLTYRRLLVGDVYATDWTEGATMYEVTAVSPCAATVRCMARRRVTIDTNSGERAEFEAPGRTVQVARSILCALIVEGASTAGDGRRYTVAEFARMAQQERASRQKTRRA
jgi:hypothetical protein